eukprot:4144613-Heterocapsa_arctica.AAC.1
MAGFSLLWWPHTVKHFCFSANISLKDGDSAYNVRHGEGHFKILKLPFGSLIEFRPPKTLLKDPPKSGKTTTSGKSTMPGIMLGYHTNIGGKWLG